MPWIPLAAMLLQDWTITPRIQSAVRPMRSTEVARWLVPSHNAEPMGKYCTGAFLLDRDDPSKVIGRLRMPLLEPSQSEREGYVPNVVYSRGALLHEHLLTIPYGLADHATGFTTVPVSGVIAGMEPVQ